MSEQKHKKFENTARKIISECFLQDIDLDMARYGLVNISDIQMSSDRSYLDIYLSCFHNQQWLTKYMSEYAHIIQKKLGTQMQTYKIPKVRFRYDDSGEIGQNIQNTINTLN